MSSEGIGATMTVEGGADGTVFRTYLEQVLAPRLQPGQVVIMDNLKAHKGAGIQKTIEAAHAALLYLPPYSPDLSPIELCWSKLKAALRGKAARTREELDQAWTAVLPTVSVSDARHWFAHCGYRTASN
jgi:transposase